MNTPLSVMCPCAFDSVTSIKPKSSDRIKKITCIFLGCGYLYETMKHVSCARYAANVMAGHDTLKCHSFLMLQNYHFMIKGKLNYLKMRSLPCSALLAPC